MSVTIVTPIYNGQRFKSQYVLSIKRVCDELSEVILVDDASTDGSASEICRELNRFISCKLICLKTNRGPANARWLGYQEAQTDFVVFLDCDDIMPRGRVSRMAASISSNKAAWAVGPFVEVYSGVVEEVVNEGNASCAWYQRLADKRYMPLEFILKDRLIGGSGVMLNKKLIPYFPNSMLRRGEDYWLWIWLSKNVSEALVVDCEPYKCIKHADNVSNDDMKQALAVLKIYFSPGLNLGTVTALKGYFGYCLGRMAAKLTRECNL